jgi:hypothetical protein
VMKTPLIARRMIAFLKACQRKFQFARGGTAYCGDSAGQDGT